MAEQKIDPDHGSSGLQEHEQTSLYTKAETVYVKHMAGQFATLRSLAAWFLLGMYYVFPWLTWNDRQAILFDLPARKFYYFNITLWPQDLIYLSWLLIILALTLFFFTSLAGRLWCGFACPQTVWTKVFLWIERVIEGNRQKRMKLDESPLSGRKLAIKSFKHFVWLIFSLYTGFTFVAYFTPVQELVVKLTDFSYGPWESFWIIFYGLATYGNAGWLREQICIYMCPYARFQSAMFDVDTLIISYDNVRGESRGSRKKNSTDYKEKGLGDCVDCAQCVQVCPTGIDIREGLQYECIACAACIDACNFVMEKMDYPKGLIDYTTDNHKLGKPEHIIRSKTILYAFILLGLISGLVYALNNRIPLEVDIIRDRSSLYTFTIEGLVENVYSIKMLNMSQQTMNYSIDVSGLENIQYLGESKVHIKSGEVVTVPIRLMVDPVFLKKSSNTIHFTAKSIEQPSIIAESESRFLGPIGSN